MSSVYLRLLILLPAILIPVCASSSSTFHNCALHISQINRVTIYNLDVLLSQPVCCSMSGFNCHFLTCIQISQGAGQVIWYSHLLKNFPQFVLIYTIKGFSVANEAEVDVFLGFYCFFYDPMDVDNFISGSSVFLNPA